MVQRVFILIAGLAFVGLMGFPLVGLFTGSSSQTNQNNNQAGNSPAEQTLSSADKEKLEEQAKGYQQVLEREPQNPKALEGLAATRLQLQDWQGAINPLEKLAATYPDQPEIWQAIAQVRINLRDLKGAIAATEKLVELEPEKQEYQNVLNLLKQQASGTPPQANQASPAPIPIPNQE